MRHEIIYTDPPAEIAESLARAVIIEDFLPPPSELVFKVKQEPTKRRVVSSYRRSMEYA